MPSAPPACTRRACWQALRASTRRSRAWLCAAKRVCIDRDEAKLPEGSVFIADLIGCRALDEDGAELGRIEDVLTMPSSDVYVIAGEKRYMVPAVREFVREIRVDEGYVRLHLIEGMAIDEN